YGMPVVYTPFFSNPTPGADNQSGLLMPQFMHSTILGAVYKQPVYYSISPDKDATVVPIYTSLAGPVIAGEYRQMFNTGQMMLDGSITSAPNSDALGNPIPGHEMRGNFDGQGNFKFGANNDWGFDVHRASDDTYLRAYGFSNDIFLTSRIYGEMFNFANSNRSYASMEGLSFQGLTGQDNGKVIPVVTPLTDITWQSNPGPWNSRVQLSGDAMVLTRQTGDDSRRLSGTAGWTLPYISEDGQMITFNTSLRTDVYDVSNVQIAGNPSFSGVTGREVPQASLMWRYPFIGYLGTSSLTIEPVVSLAASGGGGNTPKIPNEDSLLPEFNDTNLFSANRYAGLDRVEDGTGVSYGLRGAAQLYSDKYVDWLLGQHYRLSGDTSFPFSNELGSRFSDYVGKVGMTYQPLTLAYRFRFDRQTWMANRSEVDAGFNEYPLQLSTSYLSLRNDPILAPAEVVTGASALNLTPNWIWNVNASRDMKLNQLITMATGVTFKNECLTLTSMVGKDYTTLLDIKPSLTFWVTVSLKNLD
ncbi:MAG: LPS assembly protein LptD, partial [Pseudomonadota bacterium]|nr:LPS assembly protein LptD [Pseudomonadota bacterium]